MIRTIIPFIMFRFIDYYFAIKLSVLFLSTVNMYSYCGNETYPVYIITIDTTMYPKIYLLSVL